MKSFRYRSFVSILTFLLASCLVPMLAQSQRPKIAVVLSGGGAKGSAHVGALKVIERAGIPIDFIVGTSMGAVVGSLYSIGYTTSQLDSIYRNVDWRTILSDRESPANSSLPIKLQSSKFSLSVPFRSGRPAFASGGLIEGVNLGHLLHQLLYPYVRPLRSFNSMPIPFSCVAVDITDGHVVEFHDGSLQDAVRASMSIPGVFAPVRTADHVYVDGGIKNNYPVDVARRMGADIIIGVDVQADMASADQLDNFGAVLGQVIVVATGYDYQDLIKQTDVYIKVDVDGFNSGSFQRESIDTLICHGEQAAQAMWTDLVALRVRLEKKYGKIVIPERTPFHIADAETSLLAEEDEHTASLVKSFANSSVGLGVRYDNIHDVSLIAGFNFRLPTITPVWADVEGRLGSRSYIRPMIDFRIRHHLDLSLAYAFEHNSFSYYYRLHRVGSLTYNLHRLVADLTYGRNSHLFAAGLDIRQYNGDGLTPSGKINYRKGYTSYYAQAIYDSRTDQVFPFRGTYLFAEYKALTVKPFYTAGVNIAHVLNFAFQTAISPFSTTFTILPQAKLRWVANNDPAFLPENNLAGGIADNHVMGGQLSVLGLTHIQSAPDLLSTAGAQFHFHLPHKHNIVCGADAIVMSSNITGYFNDSQSSFGAMAGYVYMSHVGPLSLAFNYSGISRKLQCLVNLGFVF